MSERQFALHVCQHLDHGTATLPPPVADGLMDARQLALAHLRPARHGMLATLGGVDLHTLAWGGRMLLLSAALVLLAVAAAHVKEERRARELADVDVALLADDLPIHAYLDRGFSRWLDDGDS
jgi:hypothetical protein